MMMPRAVRMERMVLRRKARKAIRRVVKKRMRVGKGWKKSGRVGAGGEEFGGGLRFLELGELVLGNGTILNEFVAHDHAVAEDQVAFAVMRDVELVRDHHDGDALLVELLKHAHDLDRGFAIEI